MKKRYQISIIFELENESENKMDDQASELEMRCFQEVNEFAVDTFEDMVWIVDDDGKCVGSL